MADYVSNKTMSEALKKTSVAVKNYVDGKFQSLEDENLQTTNKTIVGAINELKNNLPIQSIVNGDDSSIQIVDGIVSLIGFKEAEVGSQLRKAADGTIEWALPDATTVDGLQSMVTELQTNVFNLQSDVTNLQENITIIQEIVNPSGEDAMPLLSRVETLEDKMDGNGEGSVNARIDAKINEFANMITSNGKIDTIKEMFDYIDNHSGEFNKVVNDITTLQELVGEQSVADQIAAAVNGIGGAGGVKGIKVNGTLLDLVDGVADITTPVSSNEVNKISILEDGTMEINSLNVNKLVQTEGDWLVMNGGDSSLN
jgi:hypothetical protein